MSLFSRYSETFFKKYFHVACSEKNGQSISGLNVYIKRFDKKVKDRQSVYFCTTHSDIDLIVIQNNIKSPFLKKELSQTYR